MGAWDRVRDILPTLAVFTVVCECISLISGDPNPIVGAVIGDIILIAVFAIEID